ncbi:MAG TPA: CDP-diacylglycerol--serine O-phosphatidyltransferase [Synergistales bacterium]|nr:CDP-diacylglycerol--serine O-phosphatidyltransferase [Synergistales bacterium]HQO83101.1 CDP-diacylglycerol--serine O-phosphatidyltransferase [Synergistales bacterium]HQQ10768.1 CDP-diacylglycerol--serine O-phosphatidyltransferase [Synergistales bacterium]
MKTIIPNMITSGNILCGMLSLVLAFHGHFVPASWLIFIAVVFDFMDGKMARKLGGGSSFGMELDSLADVVSFGVAPAMIMYSVYLKDFYGVAGAIVAAFFALCGALRLARFNVHHVDGSFQGLPIPAAGHFVVSFVVAAVYLPPAVMAVIVAATGFLMISNVSFSNLKALKRGNMDHRKALFLWAFAFMLIAVLRNRAPLAGILIYIVSGFAGVDWGKWLSLETLEEDDLAEDDA